MQTFPAYSQKSPLRSFPVSPRHRWAKFTCLIVVGGWIGFSFPAQADGVRIETVKMTGSFAVGKYEVTQAQYEAVTGKNPSLFKGPRKPVENVSWEDATKFCRLLTDSEHKTGRLASNLVYTLPTEKQWETCAAGTALGDAVTSFKTRRSTTENVGASRPNRFGLYDVRGNVWEWCLNPEEPGSDARVIRGGAFANSEPEKLEISYRYALTPLFKIPGIGFRVVIVSK